MTVFLCGFFFIALLIWGAPDRLPQWATTDFATRTVIVECTTLGHDWKQCIVHLSSSRSGGEFFDACVLTLDNLGGDVVLLLGMFFCLPAHDMKCLIQRSLRNQTLWQERFIDSSDDALIFSEEQLREDRHLPLSSVSLINKVYPRGKEVVLYTVAGTVAEKQKTSVIYKTTVHLSTIIKQHFDNRTESNVELVKYSCIIWSASKCKLVHPMCLKAITDHLMILLDLTPQNNKKLSLMLKILSANSYYWRQIWAFAILRHSHCCQWLM